MLPMNIPQADFALIGGSSTLSIEFPEALHLDYVRVVQSGLKFATPYGTSPEFKYLFLKGPDGQKRILTCRMHGWRKGVSRADASRQIFWVFREAGVKKILAEGGVGGINHLLRPRDLVVPHDYMDFSMRKDVGLDDQHLLIMRDSLCPDMRSRLVQVAERLSEGRVFDRGIYVNTDGRHFESPAEVNMFKVGGGDIVGQSICPEVYLAREIGACYTGLYLVVNYAEGIISPWEHQELKDIFYSESLTLGRILLDLFQELPIEQECQCPHLRKETLLRTIYT